MNNIEDKLSRVKIKSLSEGEKGSLWHSTLVARIEEERTPKISSLNIFNFKMKQIVAGVLALVVILGGGGVVVASNNAIPGDTLFPVDLAVEKIQLRLS